MTEPRDRVAYQYLITATGVTSGIVFFGETLGVNKIVGGAVILLGVYLARRQRSFVPITVLLRPPTRRDGRLC